MPFDSSSSSSSRSPTRPIQQQWWSWWSSSGPPSPHIISGEAELLLLPFEWPDTLGREKHCRTVPEKYGRKHRINSAKARNTVIALSPLSQGRTNTQIFKMDSIAVGVTTVWRMLSGFLRIVSSKTTTASLWWNNLQLVDTMSHSEVGTNSINSIPSHKLCILAWS